MQIHEIIAGFEASGSSYKRTYVDAALGCQQEITPHLIGILEKVLANPETYIQNQAYNGQIYAALLLAHFKERQAHQLIVDLFSLPLDMPYQLFGDLVTETLPALLLRTCGGSVTQIKSLILNKQAYEYCRGSAFDALVFAVVEGFITRQEALAFCGSLFTGKEAEPHALFWSLAVSAICDLYPEEMLDVIKEAYRNRLINRSYIRPSDVKGCLQDGKALTLHKLEARFRQVVPEDVHGYISGWASFQEEFSSATPKVLPPLSSSLLSPPPSKQKASPKASVKTRKKPTGKKKRKQKRAARRKNRR